VIIKPEQLHLHVQDSLLPLYWICGDEPLLLQESTDLVRHNCRRQGFSDREIFTIDKSFDWSFFLQATSNLSLFSEQKLFELRFASSKLEERAKKAIHNYLEAANPDFILLISSPRIEKASLSTKWFKPIESAGAVVQIWPVNPENLPGWLRQRLQREGINASADAVRLLADRLEGNLLAAVQEIEKIKILAGSDIDKPVNLDDKAVLRLVADNSRYNSFTLVDAALHGDAERAIKILTGLHSEDTMPLAILSALTRELRLLLPMLQKVEQGQPVGAVIQAARVWYNRKQAVSNALRRLQSHQIWQLLDQARLIDQSVKGLNQTNCWDELALLVLGIAGVKTAIMNQDKS